MKITSALAIIVPRITLRAAFPAVNLLQRMALIALVALFAGLTFIPSQADAGVAFGAAVSHVDDSGTVVGQPVTPMRWRQLAPGRAGDNTVEGMVNVALRLNLTPWLRRRVRLFMVFAPTDGEPIIATWRTQGRLLPGSMRGGDRALIYEGFVRDPFLEETILLHLTADGRRLDRTQALQFSFSIEVSP